MALITRYPDGAVFDYTNGYRSAQTVKQQKAEGTYEEPIETPLGILVSLGVIVALIVGVTTWIVAIFAMQAQNWNTVVEATENTLVGTTVVNEPFFADDKIVLQLPADEGVTSCYIEGMEQAGDEPFAAVFCGDTGYAQVVTPLPFGW